MTKKKIRAHLTPSSTFAPMFPATSTLDPSLMPAQERALPRHAPKQSFSVHQRVAPQRITSFASRRRNK